MVFMNKQLSFL